MYNQFTLEELMIRIMPGGFFLTVLFFLFENNLQINFVNGFDFFYTFLFLCASFIVGEILQTISHEVEWIIDIFFKFRRPSEVFLYKNNPVIKSENTRTNILQELNISEEKKKIFDKEYSNVPRFFQKNKENDKLSQSLFMNIFHKVNKQEDIKISNRNYLFVRVMMLEFLSLSIILYFNNKIFMTITIIIFLLFLWRARGVARGLVYKTVLLNLNNK